MKVSARFKQGILASAVIMSLTAPSAMTDSRASAALPVQETQQANSPLPGTKLVGQTKIDVGGDVGLDALLKARQAIAVGDVATANQYLERARQSGTNFANQGDSPATVQAMVERQSKLTAMRAAADPAYNAEAANFLLSQSTGLLRYNDLQSAGALAQQAQQFKISFDGPTTPEQILQAIAAAADGPKTGTANPAGKEVMSLMSQAQLAFDQQRWADAQALVDQAKSLNVPDSAFAADDVRPWQLELKIQNATKSQISGGDFKGGDFNGGDFKVVQADFVPDNDKTAIVATSGNEPALPTDLGTFQPDPTDAAVAKVAKAQVDTQPQAGGIDLSKIRAQQQGEFRKLQSAIYKERAETERLLEEDPSRALEKLIALRNRIASAELSPDTQRPLLTLVDRDITEIQSYIEKNLPEIQNREENQAARDRVERLAQRRLDNDQTLKRLVDDYNALIAERRFEEAERVVQQALDLAPNSEIAAVMDERIRAEKNFITSKEIDRLKQAATLRNLHDSDRDTIITVGDIDQPIVFNDPEAYLENARIRRAVLESQRYSNDAERDIWAKLRSIQVQGEYRGAVTDAMSQLARQAGVPIVFDSSAQEVTNSGTQIDVPLTTPVTLISALNLILDNAGLVFSVENEVIRITTPESRQANTKSVVYYVGDLLPTKEAPNGNNLYWGGNPYQNLGLGYGGGALNVNGQAPQINQNPNVFAQQLGGAAPNPFAGSGSSGTVPPPGFGGPAYGSPAYGLLGNQKLGGVTINDFGPLINLIQNTVATDTWDVNGAGNGEGTITPYAANLSLVVNNTQEVQDQIVDLLAKLRELNDVQIVIEVRFIILRDDFFERIGIDFDFALNDNFPVGEAVGANDTTSQSGVVGITDGAGALNPFLPTTNLDLQFLQGGFTEAIPTFGGFNAGTAANFGFAILSDIEVFFLLQAGKGNDRLNLTQSPVVTMFNGQSANITDGFTQPFVTSVTPVVGDFAVAHQPIITLLPDGTNLNVAATVSNDRKSVRMSLVPQFTSIGDVEEFTFTGSTATEVSTNSFLDDLLDIADPDPTDDELQTTTQGVTVQLPIIANTSVSTVVSVPDGGTILLGGIKRINEGRAERGVPFLSNIPYVNRLFKNVSVERTTSNLMMMVTPRIIIQAEEESRQIGTTDN